MLSPLAVTVCHMSTSQDPNKINASPASSVIKLNSLSLSSLPLHHPPSLFNMQGSQLIVAYDEHELNNTFKFGVVYQKFGQVRE